MKTQIQKLFLALLLGNATLAASAQGTAFTYQGRLNDNASPANGNYDLQFNLRDAPTSGNPVGTTNTMAPVLVSNGLFTVTLDFGAGAFTGPPRWLEIGVRTNGSAAAHYTLSPRQALTPSPYATYAANAAMAVTASSVANGAVVKSLNSLHDNLTLAAGANMTITPNGNTLTLAAAGVGGSGIWSLIGTNAYYNTGNVGVGRDINFGTQLRQMLNLYDTSFGVGVQNNALYQRSGGEFVWYYGGAHSDAFLNGGGGQLLLRLNTTGLVTDRSFFFQSGTKQMLNLYNTTYGIGVQPSTMYFRTDNNSAGEGFAWYKGGAHADNTADPGPNGVKLMTLTSAGLNVTAAVHAQGNATQAYDKGGFIKAMAYIDPFLPAAQYVVRCYNSQLVGNAASTSPCGITVTRLGAGFYSVDFGFPVADRFVSVTPRYASDYFAGRNTGANYREGTTPSKIEVFTFRTDEADDTSDRQFTIIVF